MTTKLILLVDLTSVDGELQFSRPILGLIVDGPTQTATDDMLGNPGTTYHDPPIPSRGIECHSEIVILSADMKNLNLELGTMGQTVEQVRIIVAGE